MQTFGVFTYDEHGSCCGIKFSLSHQLDAIIDFVDSNQPTETNIIEVILT